MCVYVMLRLRDYFKTIVRHSSALSVCLSEMYCDFSVAVVVIPSTRVDFDMWM